MLVATHPGRAGGSLLLLSFMYGVLHALGPGHGKSGDRDMAGDASFEARNQKYRGNPRRRVITGSWLSGLVVGVLTVLQLPAGQLHLSGFLAGKGAMR